MKDIGGFDIEFRFSNNFKLKMVEKIIDAIIREIRREGRLENYGIGIQNMNIKQNGNSCNIKCNINLCEDSPKPAEIDCDFNIKNDLFQSIPIYEVEGICTYSGFLLKDFGGKIKVFVNKISEDYLELTLIWLNTNKRIYKKYKVENKEFKEAVNYSDDEKTKTKEVDALPEKSIFENKIDFDKPLPVPEKSIFENEIVFNRFSSASERKTNLYSSKSNSKGVPFWKKYSTKKKNN